MEDLSPFATHFARLVWLQAQRPDDHDQHKAELRQALAQLSHEPQRVVLRDVSMAAWGLVSQPDRQDALAWIGELSVRMSAHSVGALEFDVATPAGELMEVSRALASMPAPGDGGFAFDNKLVSFSPTGVTAHIGPDGFVRRGVTAMSASSVLSPTSVRAMPALTLTPRVAPQQGRSTPDALRAVSDPAAEANRAILALTVPLSKPHAGVSDLVAQLDQAETSPNPTMLVEDVARVAQDRARRGLWTELVDVLARLHEHHERLPDGDSKRAFRMGIRHLEKPTIMLGVTRLLATRKDLRDTVTRVLTRAGDVGVEALIDNLNSSEVAAERRAYRDVLSQCPAAVGALTELLNDDRWYVARNAAELLGELGAADADERLAELLSHPEPRVRLAVTASLGKLGTSRSILSLLKAIGDDSPDVRLRAARGLGRARHARAVPWLVEALDSEQVPEVQAALLTALARTPTDASVARLAQAAEPGGILARQPQALRLRAVEALASAGTPAALEVLRGLVKDREPAVRDAATQALGRPVHALG